MTGENWKDDLIGAFGTKEKLVAGTNKKEKRPIRILAVDDESFMRFMVAEALNQPGVAVDVAENGLQAQEKILAGNYDLVITDIHMPEMDGVDLLRWMKKSRPQIKGIVITGYDISEAMTEEMSGTVTDFLEKPFSLVTLREAVRRSIAHFEYRAEKDGEIKA